LVSSSSGTIEVNGVRGFLTLGDLTYLFNLAAELPPGGQYLEMGSWMGLSAITFANGLLANVNIRARIFCVDTWEGSPEHQECVEVIEKRAYDKFLANVRHAGVEPFIVPVRGSSSEIA